MRKFANITLSLLLVLSFAPVSAFAEPWQEDEVDPLPAFEDNDGSFVEDEMIVVLAQDVSVQTPDQAVDRLLDATDAAQSAECLTEGAPGEPAILKVEVEDGADLAQAAAEVEALSDVAYVQPNYRYRLLEDAPVYLQTSGQDVQAQAKDPTASVALATEVDDPLAQNQYYLDYLTSSGEQGANVYNAWDLAQCNGSVTVAVLDTGIVSKHEDLAANILSEHLYDAYNDVEGQISTPGNPTGDAGRHGTYVSGIIAGQANNGIGIAGVSYNANVLPIKVFDDEGSYADTSTLVKAYRYLFSLVDSGELDNLHVVNMSLGSYDEEDNDILLERSIDTARSTYNIVTVCAGGNGWTSSDPEVVRGEQISGTPRTDTIYPGDYNACVAVTALTSLGNNASYSDYNAAKDISAPGNSIYSTQPNGDSTSSYGYSRGTSMAAPIVSGVLALLWAQIPNLTVDQALDSIYSTAREVPNTNEASGSHGAIDAYEALLYAQEHYPDGANTAKPVVSVTKSSWVRLSGTTAYDTMAAIVKRGWTSTGGTVVLATGEGFADALSAAGVAGLEKAPIMTTAKAALSSQTRTELSCLKPAKVVIVGGRGVVSANVESAVKKLLPSATVVRYSGTYADDTANAANLKYKGKWSTTAVLATSKGYQDALSAAPVAYANAMPIFLVRDKDTISAATISAMRALGIRKVVVAGGKGVVSDAVRAKVKAAGISVEGRSGQSAYDTSKAVAEWGISLGMSADRMGVATGLGYADALSGAALCGQHKSVIVLADAKDNTTCLPIASAHRSKITSGYVFGGKAVVSYAVQNAYERASGCPLTPIP